MTPGANKHDRRRVAIADATAGTAASLIALWAFYPVDVFKTRVQSTKVTKGDTSNQNDLVRKINWRDMLNGLESKTAHTLCSSFCYFYVYSWVDTWWKNNVSVNRKEPLAVPTRLLLSAVAAMMNTLITLPLDVLSTQHQAGGILHHDDHHEVDDDRHAEHTTSTWDHRIEDLKSLWKGLVPSLLLCSNPSINYTVYDWFKAKVLLYRTTGPNDHNLTLSEAFTLGLLAKFTATIMTYPLIRAKVMLMVTGSKKKRNMNTKSQPSALVKLWNVLVQEFKSHGIRGLYVGCDLQLIHTLLKSALLMMLRERITVSTHSILLKEK